MSKLEESEKRLVLDKIIGKMYWYGETYADKESLENMEAGYELALALIDSIYDNADLTPNAVATASGSALNKRAKEMLAYIKDICEEVNK